MRGATLTFLTLALALLAGASGCRQYKYFDIHMRFDPTPVSGMSQGFDSTVAGRVKLCKVAISGADQDSFDVPDCWKGSMRPDPLDIGSFEFSTFADSGDLTFTATAFEILPTPDCKLGDGSTTIKVTSMMTITGEIAIKKNDDGCPNVPNPTPTDGG
jgi:hypothetical protein